MAPAKLTPLGATVLGLLREDDMHAYEMLRLLRARGEDRRMPVTNGTLYHTVDRLQQQGLLAAVGVERAGNRPERTTYTLVPQGQEVLEDWVRRQLARIDNPLHFRVALSEAHGLDQEEVVRLMRARQVLLADELMEAEQRMNAARGLEVPFQYMVEWDRHVALLRADLAWTEQFVVDLAASSYAWGPDRAHCTTSFYLDSREAARR